MKHPIALLSRKKITACDLLHIYMDNSNEISLH